MSAAATSLPGEKKKSQITCISCTETVAEDNLGIKCLQNHLICQECSPDYINTLFSSPEETLPAKCPQCNVEIVGSTLEMQFDAEKSHKFNNLMLCFVIWKQEFSESEVILNCPFCSYYEIRDKCGVNFVFCLNEKCKKLSCFYCHKQCADADEEQETEDAVEDFEEHFECAELSEIKQKLEKAIEAGTKTNCPRCGLGGRKDDACTHMTCVKCRCVFCYFCGEQEDDNETIYAHNADWPTTEGRCPMYLTELSEVDERCPDDDDLCLDFFHRIQIMKNLKKVIECNNLAEVRRVEAKYKIIKNSGFTIEKILTENENLILINRA